MFELFKNPLISVTVVTVLDVIGILGFIIYLIKHGTAGKRIKKIVIAVVCFAAADAVICSFILSSNTFYDRNGNKYYEAEKISYYDGDGTVYHLATDDMEREYLISENGSQTYIAERVYIDKDGLIVYDRFNSFKQKSEYVFTDDDNGEYYPIKAVKWQKNGKIDIISK